MKIRNIERVLVYRQLKTGKVLTQEDIAEKYPLVPEGSLNYFGIVQANVDNLLRGTAMSAELHDFMQKMLTSLEAGGAGEKTVILGLEPKNPDDPYGFVSRNLELMEQLARDVTEYQAQATAAGKTLSVVMRYASEMNGNGEVYSGARYQDDYKRTFAEVRDAVKAIAPDVLFSFSPLLNADIDQEEIKDWWPGDHAVDVIGGTWYLHGDARSEQNATATMRSYYRQRVDVGKPFGIDEFGGAVGPKYRQNDQVLQRMLPVIADLGQHGVSFLYGLLFLDEGKWGSDATLDFLKERA